MKTFEPAKSYLWHTHFIPSTIVAPEKLISYFLFFFDFKIHKYDQILVKGYYLGPIVYNIIIVLAHRHTDRRTDLIKGYYYYDTAALCKK